MKKLVLVSLALCISLAKAGPPNIPIGTASVVLPAPDSYVRCDGKSKAVDAMLSSHLLSTNLELAFFCDRDDLVKIGTGRDPSFSRFFDAQVRVSLKDKDYRDPEFNDIKQSLRKYVGDDQVGEPGAQAAETVARELSKLKQRAGALKFGDVAQLGVFDETPDSICMAMLLKSTYGAGDATGDNSVRVMATAIVHVHNRVFYLNSSSLFQDETDVAWTRSEIRKWRDSVLSANPIDAGTVSAEVAPDSDEAAGYRRKARAGDIDAARELGLLYLSGKGVAQDFKEALHWLGIAGDHGDRTAGSALGNMYYTGQGVPRDFGQAFGWYRMAAQKGSLGAEIVLGAMYYKGQGVAKDYGQAFAWYRKAADQGVPSAQGVVGSMYYNGEGVSQDYAQSRGWFEKAANQGDADAQYAVGLIHEKGQGVAPDPTLAADWYKKAAAQGQPDALAALKRLGY